MSTSMRVSSRIRNPVYSSLYRFTHLQNIFKQGTSSRDSAARRRSRYTSRCIIIHIMIHRTSRKFQKMHRRLCRCDTDSLPQSIKITHVDTRTLSHTHTHIQRRERKEGTNGRSLSVYAWKFPRRPFFRCYNHETRREKSNAENESTQRGASLVKSNAGVPQSPNKAANFSSP